MSKAGKIAGDAAFVLVIAALLGGSLLFALNQDPGKTFLGYRAYNILSGSMEPELSVGDLVVVKAVPAEELQNGDIVTYYPTDQEGTTVTHRVVSTMLRDGHVVLETRGDAAGQSDPLIYGESVIGVVVFHIPLLGAAIAWIQSHLVLSVGAVALLFAAWLAAGALGKKPEKPPAGRP